MEKSALSRVQLRKVVNTLQQQNTSLFEHVNLISSSSLNGENAGASKGYILHLAMYGISLMGELNELRRQY